MPNAAASLARRTLAAFVITFFAARVMVLLIMTRRVPDFYFYAGETHVHHLNYGIFLLVIVAGWAIFASASQRHVKLLAVLYGVGLGLTFDEFGMWLNLDEVYWQRASYDGVLSIAALLGLIAYAPAVRQFRSKAWAVTAAIVLLIGSGACLIRDHAKNFEAHLRDVERAAPQ
ncbi:MAG TPA: hypothetical protein VGB55_05485 [Tepidisphaeraceae bacterium]